MKNNVNILACGGAGISIGSKVIVDETKPGRAGVTIAYLDTSRSDLVDGVDQTNVFIAGEHTADKVAAAEGSGKVRARNNAIIKPLIPKIIHTFKPSDVLNIIICSASGGSGPVFANHLLNYLLDNNKPVLVFVISSIGSLIETDNSIKTLKSFENSAIKSGVPVIVSHWQNDKLTPESSVDTGILALIDRLLVLYSGENRKIDKEDLKNFLKYTAVTSRKSKLVYLDVYDETSDIPADVDIITVATLANEGMDTSFDVDIEYQTAGFVKDSMNLKLKGPLHFCVVDGHAANALRQLEGTSEALQQNIKNRQSEESIFTGGASATDDIFL